MAKRRSDQPSFEVGYGKPPVPSRFSTTHQPARTKARGPDSIDLGAEKRPARREGGRIDKITADDAMIEIAINDAIRGNISQAKYIFELEDKELRGQSRRKERTPDKRNVKLLVSLFKSVLQRFTVVYRQLASNGLATRSLSGRLEISDRVAHAIKARRHGELE